MRTPAGRDIILKGPKARRTARLQRRLAAHRVSSGSLEKADESAMRMRGSFPIGIMKREIEIEGDTL